MPSIDQCNELVNNCLFVWTIQNGVYGEKIIGMNGGTIFLPAAGFRLRGDLKAARSTGYYWSSTCGMRRLSDALYLSFDSEGVYTLPGIRFYGCSVRPVRKN